MTLDWSHPDGFPGIYLTEYKGHKLRINPVGSGEWDGLIDGKLCSGTDDLDLIEYELICFIDGVSIDLTITITVIAK